MLSEDITLIVKSPNDKTPNHVVSCQLSWTVRELKAHLCSTHPSHPEPASQRLIHAGKLMLDDSKLATVFKERYSGTPTIHLISRSSKATATKPVADQIHGADLSGISPEDLQKYQREYYEYLRQFYLQNPNLTSSICPTESSWPYATASYQHPGCWPFVNYWPNPVSQVGLYGYGNPPSSSLPPSFTGLPPTTQPHTENVSPNAEDGGPWVRGARAVLRGLGVDNNVGEREVLDGNQPADARPQHPPPAVLGNPMGAAFAGAEEMGENAGNMDIVDRFYLLFRLCLFIGLCFAYSSLDKAIIVFSVAAYVYFYNVYRRHVALRRAIIQAQQQPVEHPNAVLEAGNPNESNGEVHADLGAPQVISNNGTDIQGHQEASVPRQPNSTTSESAPTAAQPRQRFTRITSALRLFVTVLYQFVSSLITSLIPEQPLPMRLD
ncbi:unnamed protein product [Dicrocoelium dendriticum]|nr:unnamed protein product [Dicrocoelium dendriticum]